VYILRDPSGRGEPLVREYLELSRTAAAPSGALRVLQELQSHKPGRGRGGGGGGGGGQEAAVRSTSVGREEVLSAFCDRLLAGKDRPAPSALGTYAGLMQTLTPDELATKVRQGERRAAEMRGRERGG
jgi:hypothetical protein